MVEIKHRRGVQNPFRRGGNARGLPTHYGSGGSFKTHNGGHSPLARLRNICVFMVVGGLALYTFLGSSSSSEAPVGALDELKAGNLAAASRKAYEQQQQQQQQQEQPRRGRTALRSRSRRDSKRDSLKTKKRPPSDSGDNNNKMDSNEEDLHRRHEENPDSHEEEEEEEVKGHHGGLGDGSKNGPLDSHSMDAENKHLLEPDTSKQVPPEPMANADVDSQENKLQKEESKEENRGMDSHDLLKKENSEKHKGSEDGFDRDQARKRAEDSEDNKDKQSHDNPHPKDQKEVVGDTTAGDKEVKDGLDTTASDKNDHEGKTDHLGFVIPPGDSKLAAKTTTTPGLKTPTITPNVTQTTVLAGNSNTTDTIGLSATNKTAGDATTTALLNSTTAGSSLAVEASSSMLKNNDTTAAGDKKEGDEDHALEVVGDTSLEVVSDEASSKKSEKPLHGDEHLPLHGPANKGEPAPWEEAADANFQPLHKEGKEEEAADANFQPLHKSTKAEAPRDDKDSAGSATPKNNNKVEGWKEAEMEILEPIYNKDGDNSPDDQHNNEPVADKGKEAGLDSRSTAKNNAMLDETLPKASEEGKNIKLQEGTTTKQPKDTVKAKVVDVAAEGIDGSNHKGGDDLHTTNQKLDTV